MNKKALSFLIGAALFGVVPSAWAITDEEGNASIQFSFVPPGARSLGMAGAFLGRADDATAAYTNPAGLTQLSQFEISAEGRHVSYDSGFVAGGTFTSSPQLDLSGLRYDESSDSVNGLAYFAVVWPHERWSVAFYRHELVQYETSFALVDDVSATNIDFFLLDYDAAIDLDVVNYGLSGAFKVSDRFSLGASVIWSDFELDSSTVRFNESGQPLFGTSQQGDDDDVAFNVGALFRLSDQWQIGAVYRDAPQFDAEANLFAPDGTEAPGFPRPTEFNAPDIFGVGLSFQPNENWTFTFDVNRVYYSDLTDGLNSGFRANDADDLGSIRPLQIDDGTELRLGAEYTFLEMARPFSVRGGVWRDPEHTITFNGVPSTDPNSNALSNAVLFSTGDDEVHFTLGAGIVFDRFNIDAAVDFSDNSDTFSISGVLRFE